MKKRAGQIVGGVGTGIAHAPILFVLVDLNVLSSLVIRLQYVPRDEALDRLVSVYSPGILPSVLLAIGWIALLLRWLTPVKAGIYFFIICLATLQISQSIYGGLSRGLLTGLGT